MRMKRAAAVHIDPAHMDLTEAEPSLDPSHSLETQTWDSQVGTKEAAAEDICLHIDQAHNQSRKVYRNTGLVGTCCSRTALGNLAEVDLQQDPEAESQSAAAETPAAGSTVLQTGANQHQIARIVDYLGETSQHRHDQAHSAH